MKTTINKFLETFKTKQVNWQEQLDDPNLALELRKLIFDELDYSNRKLGVYKQFSQKLYKWWCKQKEPQKEISILEVGSGAGGLPQFIIGKFKNIKINYYLFDLDPEILKWAQQKCKDKGVEVNFYVADSTFLKQFKDKQFDIVISLQALHHIQPHYALRNFFTEVKRVSRKGFFMADFERKPFNIVTYRVTEWLFDFHEILLDDGLKSLKRAYSLHELKDNLGDVSAWEVQYERFIWNPFVIIKAKRK